MSQPTVSVVIPTRNRCAQCMRAVESALAQDLPPLEVLVCDDGSEDGTERMLLELAKREPRLRYLRLDPPPKGPGQARNVAVEAARGDWIAFLDDDDRWLPAKLVRQLAAAAQTNADVVATNALRASGLPYFSVTVNAPTRHELERANPIILSTAMVRRQLLLANGGFPNANWARWIEDYVLWLRLADRGATFAVLAEPLAHYNDAPSGRGSDRRLRVALAMCVLRALRVASSPLSPLRWRLAVRECLQAVLMAVRTACAPARALRSAA